MQESGALRHIPWHELTTRESEIRGLPLQDGQPGQPQDGDLDEREASGHVDGDEAPLCSSEEGRGHAYGKNPNFEVHEDIVNWFQTELDRNAIHGHNKITVDQ
eukprot:8227626-Karenia_brevis.AAC.1